MALRSLRLGIFGQADTVEFLPPDGLPFPVEYKRGKPKSHDADLVQLCAQGLCLEEMLARPVPAGALFYGKTRRRLNVPFDTALRQRTLEVIADVRAMTDRRQTPRAVYAPRRCKRCSLLRLCMPQVLEGSESASRYLARSVRQLLNESGPAGEM